jgi:hypothetical protein
MRAIATYKDASELINLKITAFDTKEGSFSYYKTVLINTEPTVTT